MSNRNDILYFDAFYEVQEAGTGKVVFKTELDEDLWKTLGRQYSDMDEDVVINVVTMWNEGKTLAEIDDYLLDEGRCSQEEREIIVEGIYKFFGNVT